MGNCTISLATSTIQLQEDSSCGINHFLEWSTMKDLKRILGSFPELRGESINYLTIIFHTSHSPNYSLFTNKVWVVFSIRNLACVDLVQTSQVLLSCHFCNVPFTLIHNISVRASVTQTFWMFLLRLLYVESWREWEREKNILQQLNSIF